MTTLGRLEEAAEVVHRVIRPTPQICWPLLSERCGCEVWVKHENHTPVGAFKVRGGLVYFDDLIGRGRGTSKVVLATRGNHGQSIAFAAQRHGVSCLAVVPHGNSREKNLAMSALGAQLVEHGDDFTAAFDHAAALADDEGLPMVPSFHPLLVRGVATYSLELLRSAPDLETVYVPIGLGSGICGMLAARDALGVGTTVVGVVASAAPTYALSFAAGRPVAAGIGETIADGVATGRPDPDALESIRAGVDRIVQVNESEIRAAMRHYFTDTHNVAEGAGAAGLAALLQEGPAKAGRRVGLVLSGGNVDREVFAETLSATS
jgi:threonine dehydratase